MIVTLVHWATTTSHILVNVYAGGERLGSLAFGVPQWRQLQADGQFEVFIGEKYDPEEAR